MKRTLHNYKEDYDIKSLIFILNCCCNSAFSISTNAANLRRKFFYFGQVLPLYFKTLSRVSPFSLVIVAQRGSRFHLVGNPFRARMRSHRYEWLRAASKWEF